VHSIRIVAFHAILSASRRPESFYTLLTLSQKQGNTEAQRPQSEMLWFPLWSLLPLCFNFFAWWVVTKTIWS
jgi:hypothetical protein